MHSVKNQVENIYDVVEKIEEEIYKSPRYVSKYSKNVQKVYRQNRTGHRTMGFAKYPLQSPQNYLKKQSGLRNQQYQANKKIENKTSRHPIKAINSKKNINNSKIIERSNDNINLCNCTEICQCSSKEKLFTRKCTCSKKPPVPKKETTPILKTDTVLDKKTSKHKDNVILRNILNVIKTKPKNPTPRYIDTRYGARHNLTSSGLEPHYILQKSFGKRPKYILKLLSEREKREQFIRDEELRKNEPACRYITQAEREKLLEGLKTNWAELQKKYQGLPIMTDSVPKILRKTQMEAELKQLEKDIVLVERHPYIYVYNQ